jgi:ligand-binding sensor domain-containing protein/signal transduction histidine kinase
LEKLSLLRQFLLILILIFCLNNGYSQDPYSISITTENGLPSNAVYDIYQDKKGFIWIASDAGLSRYDGFEFITYTNDDQSSRSGSNIREDKYGRIWYQNFDGFLFYVENGKLKSMYSHHPVGYYPIGIIKDKLFAIDKRGVVIYDLKTFRKLSSIKTDYIVSSEQTESHYYALSSPYYKIDYSGKSTKIKAPVNMPVYEMPGLLRKGKHHKWLISRSNHEKMCFQLTDKGIKPAFPLKLDAFIQSLSYTPSSLWLCTPKGVYRYSEDHPEKSTHYFPTKNVSCVMQDREGNYWICTQNDGIVFTPDIDRKLLFPDLKPHKISIAGNNVFLGSSDDRIYKLDLKQQKWSLLFNGGTNHMVDQILYDASTQHVFFTSDVFSGIQTSGKKLFSLIMAAKDYRFLDRDYIAIAASGSCSIYEINNNPNSYWNAAYHSNKQWINGMFYWNLIEGVRAKSVEYLPKEHRLYFATNIGLFETDGHTNKPILNKGKNIYCVKLARHNHQIYALTSSGKIIRFDKRNKVISLSDTLQLSTELIQRMEVMNGKLLLSSQSCIYVYDLNNQLALLAKFHTHSQEITALSWWKEQLVIVTKKGVILQPLSKSTNNQSKPRFVLNALKANQRLLSTIKSNELSHYQNNIEINYSILSFSNDGNVPLYYNINHQGWELASDNTRTLKLAALSPDNYTISFKLGTNSQLQSVQFVIHPAWYATSWFLTVSIAVGFFIFFFYFRGRIRSLQKRNALLSQKVELEENLTRSMLTSIKSQMNPHFFYNALNTIQSFIFTDDKKNASIYLSKFSKLTRMILEMSDKETVRLAEEINALTLYLDIEKVRFDTDFEFSIEVDNELDIDLINIPSMIIQPYVENAVKHGLLHKKGAKQLTIHLYRNPTHLMIQIDDNGIGRARANELNQRKTDRHQSFATAANQKRLELLNSGRNTSVVIQYIDKPEGSGTTVIISIPIVFGSN